MVGEQQQILLSPYSIREKSMVVKYIIIPLLEGNRAVQGSGVHFFAKPEVGAAFITPAFRRHSRWEKRPGGRDECCPYLWLLAANK